MSTIRIPHGIWMLGLVSLCMDLSSEMIHSLLPVYLVTVLGASTLSVGLIEGIAEATAAISKIFSGVLSDRFGRRKPLVVAGYGLAALTKPLFPLASSAGWVLTARFADRIGKGIRGAPRDALVADLTPAAVRGAAFGLRQALDTAGALLGPLVAIVLMFALAGNIRAVFWFAALPAMVAVAVLVFFVHEPAAGSPAKGATKRELPAKTAERRGANVRFGGAFWWVVSIGAIFSMARFSEAFLVLRALDAGLSLNWTPLALVVMNLAYVAAAYPFGKLSDRVSRSWLLAGGLVVLISADVLLAIGAKLAVVLVGIALWGLHMGLTQGLLSAMVADASPTGRRGAAFGIFYFASGISMLLGSTLAGALWQWRGPLWAFLLGAALSAVAMAGLIWGRSRFVLARADAANERLE